MDTSSEKIYLDYNATTPLDKTVVKAIKEALEGNWANPSSSYISGKVAKAAIENARSEVAMSINARKDEIIFTSGGTEDFQLWKKKMNLSCMPHIITSNVEHPSVFQLLKHLESQAVIELSLLPVDQSGLVSYAEISKVLRFGTCLITVMLANNETGVLFPISLIGRIGALYACNCDKEENVHPMFWGGGQEKGLRSGTENTPMIVGLGKASKLVSANLQHYMIHFHKLRTLLENTLQNSPRLPNTSSVAFVFLKNKGVTSADLLKKCKFVLASTAAACHLSSTSDVLLASHVPPEMAKCTVRLSLGRETTEAEVMQAVEDLFEAFTSLDI